MNKAEFMDKAKNNPAEALEILFDAVEAAELSIGVLVDEREPAQGDATEADLVNA